MKRIITSVLTVMAFGLQVSHAQHSGPKLIIGLTIDQLRTDYMEAFAPLYGDKGFKRLWREGRVYKNAGYNFNVTDRAAAVASLYTGTTPSVNGIISEYYLDRSTLRPRNVVDDPAFMGYYSEEFSSADQLLTSTLGDELKIATRGKALVYSIAPFREAAVFAAGHSANGAFWINNITGKWSGTTYYEDFPWWVSQYNDRKALDFRLNGMTWTPLLPVNNYKYLTGNWEQEDFKHKFDDVRSRKFRKFKTSPLVNEEVNALVGNYWKIHLWVRMKFPTCWRLPIMPEITNTRVHWSMRWRCRIAMPVWTETSESYWI